MPPANVPIDTVADILDDLRATPPLVHCLTNEVVKNFTANALLALGAAPAMVEHPVEAAEFAAIADALLINLGTLGESEIEPIRRAVGAATAAGTPWVLDPVAIGALSVRTALAQELLGQHPTLIRGNASEIIALAGGRGSGRGVDSGDPTEAALEAAQDLARRTGGAVLVTGQTDLFTDGERVGRGHNGHLLLTRVTGVGCAQGAIAAACLARASSPLAAAAAAATLMGVAGEKAARGTRNRPGSFQIALLDALSELDRVALLTTGSLG
ncbi:MAG: hydroxyethylthiazole kinase [Opitutales bacterium]